VVDEKMPLKRVRDLKVVHPKADAFLLWARNAVGAMSKHYPAPLKCIDAVEAAVTKRSFDEGQKAERAAFLSLYTSDEHRALKHVFFAERAAAKIADVPDDTPVRPIARVGVIGAGTMGTGIAINFLEAELPVTMLEMKQEALDRGVAAVRKVYEGRVGKGKLKQDQADAAMALLQPTLSYDDLRAVDLVIEAVFEDLGVKEKVFRKLDEVCKPDAILASNTSTLDLDAIAAFTKRPQDVVGMHFFSPANVMKLLELVRGAATGKDVLATMMQLAKKIGRPRSSRRVRQLHRQPDGRGLPARGVLLARRGRRCSRSMRARGLGMAMGIFKMGDSPVAISVGDPQAQIRGGSAARRFRSPTGCARWDAWAEDRQRFYRYEPGRRDALHDAVVDDVVVLPPGGGDHPRRIDDGEIVQRCIYALVNEARASRGRHRAARVRHRHCLSVLRRVPALARRPHAVRGLDAPDRRRAHDEAFCGESARRSRVLATGAAACPARGRRQGFQSVSIGRRNG
jgi:3-hydroxyacyl-CoA dehydrogenase